MRWSEVQYREVFMEKVYRGCRLWEVKDWGEGVSELMIGGWGEGGQLQKLYVVLSYVGVFTFCVCIVASFKLSCV